MIVVVEQNQKRSDEVAVLAAYSEISHAGRQTIYLYWHDAWATCCGPMPYCHHRRRRLRLRQQSQCSTWCPALRSQQGQAKASESRGPEKGLHSLGCDTHSPTPSPGMLGNLKNGRARVAKLASVEKKQATTAGT